MSIEWKEGPPPEGEVGVWLVWSAAGGERIAFRIVHRRPLRVHDARPEDEPASGWEASITHHHPHKITPPGEAPTLPSDPSCNLPEHGACCCTCRWHKSEVRGQLGGERTGRWVCWAPELEDAYFDFPEHSLCEMWQGRTEDDVVRFRTHHELPKEPT